MLLDGASFTKEIDYESFDKLKIEGKSTGMMTWLNIKDWKYQHNNNIFTKHEYHEYVNYLDL